MLNVNEMFVSYQGEGPRTGAKSLFIRLQGCNLKCDWCDSKDSTWNIEGEMLTAKEIYERFEDSSFNNVVITGGEPLLQQNDPEFQKLIHHYTCHGDVSIEIETNGTIEPNFYGAFRVFYNVSPKLKSSGMENRASSEALEFFANGDDTFKFVVDLALADPFAEVREIQEAFNIPDYNIFVMAEGTDASSIIDSTTDLMQMDHPYNVSTRAHILFKVK
jgi:7-carboxy-7-deazaguanine synthase